MNIADDTFEELIAEAMDSMPEHYSKEMNNVVVTWENDPSSSQREKLRLRCNETLFGLYEGIPQTARGAGYNLVLPDKITIFKNPLSAASPDLATFKKHIKHTLWHELAHHFGLTHARIHELERKHASEMSDSTIS